MRPLIEYDRRNTLEEAVGDFGIRETEWRATMPRIEKARRAVLRTAATGKQGFMRLPFERRHAEESLRVLRSLPRGCTDLVVLGIGGSDLGARAILRACGKKGRIRVRFAGSSTDPDQLADLLADLNLKRTCVNVISKSGGTLEPMSAFLVLREKLLKAVGKRKLRTRIIATTDPKTGDLRRMAEREDYHTLEIPPNVGGRFSVLSSVGLFPAAAGGADIRSLLAGARSIATSFKNEKLERCPVCAYAGIHAIAAEMHKTTANVLMPYVYGYDEFARWYRQLIAESLGKKETRKKVPFNFGLTPIAAMGPEDQHSQLQLYTEGPHDKIITFIESRTFQNSLQTPEVPMADVSLRQLYGLPFSRLVHAERETTAEALRLTGRPNETLFIQQKNETSLGGLMMFFEIATAMLGELFDVNAYDQPGVECSKKLMSKRLFRS